MTLEGRTRGDDWRAYAESDAFKRDLAEAQRLIRANDEEGIAAFLSRDVEERAREAATRARKRKTTVLPVWVEAVGDAGVALVVGAIVVGGLTPFHKVAFFVLMGGGLLSLAALIGRAVRR
jgi:anti-sigma factor RsiW